MPGRINLKAVAEALVDRGLDPTVEILRVLAPVDKATGERAESRLEPDVQVRIWNELLQFTQPKLKSVEVKGTLGVTKFDITDEQAKAIAAEFLRANGGGE